MLQILRAAALLQSRLDAVLRPFDLTTDRWRALAFVAKNPGAAMADLIEALAMPATSATRTVDALVETGAIFRSPHPSDRRRVTLRLSAPGKRLLLAANAAIEAMDLADRVPAQAF